MAGLRPPKGVAPERLFRLLTRKPRPRLALEHRVAGADDIELHVVALTGAEEADCFDAGDVGTPEGRSAVSAALITASLHTAAGRAFRAEREALLLPASDFDLLATAVIGALGTVSPTDWRADRGAWDLALRIGARHPKNIAQAVAMADSADIIMASKAHFEPRPDRYFGMPLSDLTDGHRMAFRAAWGVVKELRGQS